MRNHDRQEGVGGESTQVWTLLKVRKATDWKAAAWNLEWRMFTVFSLPLDQLMM